MNHSPNFKLGYKVRLLKGAVIYNPSRWLTRHEIKQREQLLQESTSLYYGQWNSEDGCVVIKLNEIVERVKLHDLEIVT